MTIGERVKELRKQINLTQQAFADRLNLKRNTVGSYEVNVVEPTERSPTSAVSATAMRRGCARVKGRCSTRSPSRRSWLLFSLTLRRTKKTASNGSLWKFWPSWSPKTGNFLSGWRESCKKKRETRKGSPSFATLIYFISLLAYTQIRRSLCGSAFSSSLIIASM